MIYKIQKIIAKLSHHIGLSISFALHFCLFIFLLISFPQCQNKKLPEIMISVDLLPISKNTNVENKKAKQTETKPKEKPIEKVIEEPKKAIEENKPEPKPEPEPKADLEPKIKKQEETPKPKEKAKPEPKKETAKPKEKAKKPVKKQSSEYDSILKNLEKAAKEEISEEETDKPSKGPHNAELPLSLSVKDSIKKQIEKCWNPPAGNKDAGKLVILLNISFKQDGTVANVKTVDSLKYNSDELYRVAADAAIRAVHKCSPLQDLPVEQYSLWQNLEFNFDPSDLIY